jgi:hypothetical protein
LFLLVVVLLLFFFFVGAFVFSSGDLAGSSSLTYLNQCLRDFWSTLFPSRVRVLGLPRQGLRDCGIAEYGGSRQPCLSHLTFRAHSTLALRRPRESAVGARDCGSPTDQGQEASNGLEPTLLWDANVLFLLSLSLSLSLYLFLSVSLALSNSSLYLSVCLYLYN